MKINHYTQSITEPLKTLFQKADTLKAQIDKQKNKNINLWETILQKLKVDWTYNSNSIEGTKISNIQTIEYKKFIT